MRVWLTRTEPGASRQATQLAGHGFDILKAPVLCIEPSTNPLPEGCFDVVVFVSEHAISCAGANGWHGGPAVVIGAAAERALRNLGVEPRWPTQANAQGVVDILAPSPPRNTLVVKGVGGTGTLQRWLRSERRALVEWEVYRRVPLSPSIEAQCIDAIVAGSGDGLRVIGQLWFAQRRDAGVPLLVPSERVAGLAAAMGFEHVVVTAGAGPGAVVESLFKLMDGSVNG